MLSAQQFEGSSPTRRLRILYLEDSRADATLVEATLAESGLDFEFKCVETEAEFRAALQPGSWDVILSDYRLPSFDGMAALELARVQLPKVPFIFVSGGIGEERAIETLKAGATDYVLKDRLKRLVPSIERAVREAADRAEHVALAAENERLLRVTQEASQRKDEFLAMLAHELRNPLGAILGAAQLIDLVAHDKEAVMKADEIIQRQGKHMARLLDDLLDVARVTQGKISLRQELVDLTDLVDDAVAAVRPHITARQQDFSVEIADAPFYVLGDATRLEQVQVNLLTNASRYSASNEQIRLRLTREGDQAVLSVRDNGLGIAPEMLDRIFDLFVQSDETFNRSAGGLGVGLTLVRSLVEMHGGQVTAHSAGLGCGSEFVVRLPLASAPKAATPQTPSIPSRQPRHRILLVEDNVDSREMLKDLLELDGHEVQTAEDGVEGASIVETGWPDLVLMDIGLPGLSGYDTARLIRANGHRDLRLVALTGYGQPADRQSALEAGFDDHLVKPFNPADLTRILSQNQNN